MKGNCCLKIFSESHCPVVLWTLCLEKASVSVSVFGPLQYIILDVQVKYISHRNVVGEKHFKIFPSRKVFSTSLWQQNLTSTFWKVCWSWIPLVLWFVLVRAGLGQLLFQNLLDTTQEVRELWGTCLCSYVLCPKNDK